jgi:hypothetical protein
VLTLAKSSPSTTGKISELIQLPVLRRARADSDLPSGSWSVAKCADTTLTPDHDPPSGLLHPASLQHCSLPTAP